MQSSRSSPSGTFEATPTIVLLKLVRGSSFSEPLRLTHIPWAVYEVRNNPSLSKEEGLKARQGHHIKRILVGLAFLTPAVFSHP